MQLVGERIPYTAKGEMRTNSEELEGNGWEKSQSRPFAGCAASAMFVLFHKGNHDQLEEAVILREPGGSKYAPPIQNSVV